MKATLLCRALRNYTYRRQRQGNAKKLCFNPMHPEVQTSAGTLIEVLINKCDFFDAERYAPLTFDSLRNPRTA
jgi:uncharacterized lipoprotein YddW (UPF0748 family)